MRHSAKLFFVLPLLASTMLSAPVQAQIRVIPAGTNNPYLRDAVFFNYNVYGHGVSTGRILFNGTGVVHEGGSLEIHGRPDTTNTSTMTNNGLIHLYSGFLITTAPGRITNNGTFRNDGTFTNGPAFQSFLNNGVIENQSYFFNAGRLDNHGRFETSGWIQNSSTFNNYGTIDNYGYWQAGGNIIQDAQGEIIGWNERGTVNNYGTFNSYDTYTGSLRPEGRYHDPESRISGAITNAATGTINFYADKGQKHSVRITGEGSINKYGAAELELTGDSSSFAGTTAVQQGTLRVNGSLGGAIAVGNNAALAGSGVLGGVTMQSGSRLSPGAFDHGVGMLIINESLSMQSGSVLDVDLLASGIGGGDHVRVQQGADIQGASMQINTLNPKTSYQNGRKYAVLYAAGGLTGTFADVVSSSAFLTGTAEYTANQVNVIISVMETPMVGSGQGIRTVFGRAAETPNQFATAYALDYLTQEGESLELYNSLLMLNTGEAQNAFDQLSGSSHASTQSGLATVSQTVGNMLNSRLSLASLATATPAARIAYGGDEWASFAADSDSISFWTRALGSRGSLDGSTNGGGLDHRTGGILFGGDALLGDWRAGLMAGYSQSDFSSAGRHNEDESNSYHIGAYGGRAWGSLALRSGIHYSWHDIDSSRIIVIPGYAGQLEGDYDASTTQAFAELGYTFKADALEIEPFINLSHLYLSSDSFTESGGAGALHVDSDNAHISYASFGLHGRHALTLGEWNGMANGTLGWQHAFGDTTPSAAMSLNAAPFVVDGAPIAQGAALVGFGLGFALSDDATLSVNYQGQYARDAKQNSVAAQVKLAF